MIRDCQTSDIPWVYTKAVEFNEKWYDVPLDPARAMRSLAVIHQTGVMIRSDTGAIVGLVMPDPFRAKEYLVELGWFDTGRNGIKLFDAFEKRARELRVDEIRMTTLEANSKVGALLERRGYKALEHGWGLRLGD